MISSVICIKVKPEIDFRAFFLVIKNICPNFEKYMRSATRLKCIYLDPISQQTKYQIIMTLYKKTIEGSYPYETPLVKPLEILSEGVLCGSFTTGGGGSYGDGDINDNGEY